VPETLVELRALAEAVLGIPRISVELPAGPFTPATLTDALVRRSPTLRRHVLHENGTLRSSTKVLAGGGVVGPNDALPSGTTVTLIPAFPCDG